MLNFLDSLVIENTMYVAVFLLYFFSLFFLTIFLGGEFSWHIVLVMGFSTITANALSLGAGEYLSSKAHREFIQVEKRRETWEFKHFKDVETREVFTIFSFNFYHSFFREKNESEYMRFTLKMMYLYFSFYIN